MPRMAVSRALQAYGGESMTGLVSNGTLKARKDATLRERRRREQWNIHDWLDGKVDEAED